jgi:ribosome-binding protein aMBF1 (putative translation factor)
MIRTDAEYQRALDRLDQETETLQAQREQLEEMDLSEKEIDHALGPMISFREQLREEADTYERMRRGDLGALHDLTSIGRWLIGARIARGWTVTELAERLGVSTQQVSRDERNEYRGVSAERAQRILQTLGVRYRLQLEEPLSDERERELVPA